METKAMLSKFDTKTNLSCLYSSSFFENIQEQPSISSGNVVKLFKVNGVSMILDVLSVFSFLHPEHRKRQTPKTKYFK
jgi:hypothetical protein